jgi:hypothetical protein
MNRQEFKMWVIDNIKTNPTLKSDIIDFYQLALSEIEEGGSEQHEISLAVNDINELINENL